MRLLEKISSDLQVPLYLLDDALAESRRQVKHIKIPKKNKTFRTVYQPSKKLKIIQYWLLHNVFKTMHVDSCAAAYRNGLSIRDNAEKHKNNKYFLKMDFENFFPSIRFDDLVPLLDRWRIDVKHEWSLDLKAKDIIRLSCFYRQDRLAIGYPTSPIISNIVMSKFDSIVNNYIEDERNKIGNVVYTRYADDLTFSTDKKKRCDLIHKKIMSIVSTLKSPQLIINSKKTRFVSSSGGSAIVTGIRICHDNHLTLHRKYKDKVRLLLSLYDKGSLREEDAVRLIGHLSYVKGVDPVFYTKMQEKYFKAIDRLNNE